MNPAWNIQEMATQVGPRYTDKNKEIRAKSWIAYSKGSQEPS